MEKNENTYVYKKNLTIEDKNKPKTLPNFQYVPEGGDKLIICESTFDALTKFSGPADGQYTELYHGVFPSEYNKPGDEREYHFLGYKAGGNRTFFLY